MHERLAEAPVPIEQRLAGCERVAGGGVEPGVSKDQSEAGYPDEGVAIAGSGGVVGYEAAWAAGGEGLAVHPEQGPADIEGTRARRAAGADGTTGTSVEIGRVPPGAHLGEKLSDAAAPRDGHMF